jgi:hypothetical protein
VGASRQPSPRRRKRLRRSGPAKSRSDRARLRRFGWRWRRNPLRRRTDLVEAWLGVLTAVLFCLAPVVGWWAGQSVDRTLQGVVRAQRAARTLVTATVVPAGAPSTAASKAAAVDDGRRGDILRWTGPDGSAHSKKVSADLEVWRSSGVRLWTDRHGELVPAPLDGATAATHAVLAGIAVGAATGGMVLIFRSVLVWRLTIRRMAFWEREWARAGQDWGHAGAGG